MISMAERVKTLRGQLAFARMAHGGTRVEVRFPVGAKVQPSTR